VTDQAQLWSRVYDHELGDLLHVQRSVARSVAESLAFELLPDPRAPGTAPPAEAYEMYLQGRFFWNKGNSADAWNAIDWYRRALEAYPSYALAYSGIADCYGRLVWFSAATPLDAGEKAKAAADQALRFEWRLAEAHASMALVRFWYDWNWVEAEKEFRRAAELRPNYADAHNWYSAYLNVMGRFEDAAAEQKIAEELDPLSLTIAMNAADPFYLGRRPEKAIEILQRVLTREPFFFPAHYNLGRAYAAIGRYEEAAGAFGQAARLSGNRQGASALAYALARAGRTAEARAILEEMTALLEKQYVPAPQLALIHLGLNETEKALDLLERGLDERSYWMVYLHADPVYDAIRSEPRFSRILAAMRLPV
jgi:serine/threonine-protein kinase